MHFSRRWLRNAVGGLLGVQGDLQVWWTPHLPLVYIANPKAGCSTIKHSLKVAQADAYARHGRHFTRVEDEPHLGDDCLRRKGLAPRACREKFLISCVRNPYARALSAYLDKVPRTGTTRYPELVDRDVSTFESFLGAIARCEHRYLDPHFRPQWINLDLPRLSYDAIFFLENLEPLRRFLAEVHDGDHVETFAPHSRSASTRLSEHYTPRAIDLVREIFAGDFTTFGYSTELDDVGAAPGGYIAACGNICNCSQTPIVPDRPVHAHAGTHFETALRYRRLVDLRIL
jgi:hypothetical protein